MPSIPSDLGISGHYDNPNQDKSVHEQIKHISNEAAKLFTSMRLQQGPPYSTTENKSRMDQLRTHITNLESNPTVSSGQIETIKELSSIISKLHQLNTLMEETNKAGAQAAITESQLDSIFVAPEKWKEKMGLDSKQGKADISSKQDEIAKSIAEISLHLSNMK